MVGESEVFRKVLEIAAKVAPTESTDLKWPLAEGRSRAGDPAAPLDPAAAYVLAVGYAREAALPAPVSPRRRRAPG